MTSKGEGGVDDRDLVESFNRSHPPGSKMWTRYQPVHTVSRAFCLGGVGCVWVQELDYPVKLVALSLVGAIADPGVGHDPSGT